MGQRLDEFPYLSKIHASAILSANSCNIILSLGNYYFLYENI
jgi:hypothetical protein